MMNSRVVMNTRSQWGGNATERSAGIAAQGGLPHWGGSWACIECWFGEDGGAVLTQGPGGRIHQETRLRNGPQNAHGGLAVRCVRCGAFNQTDSVFCLSVILSV